jgi:hypothetical protein
MHHSSTLATTALLLLLAAACDNASSDLTKAKGAQAEANDKSGAAQIEANEKIKSAQAEADEKTAAVRADVMKMREDYRHTTVTNLVDLDHKVADLVTKSNQSTGKTKTDIDASLKQIHASREVFDRDYKSLEGAPASGWDDAKVRLDKEWSELKALVDKA